MNALTIQRASDLISRKVLMAGPAAPPIPASQRFGGVRFDSVDLDQALAHIAARPEAAPFDYVSTPNAEFIAWAHRRPEFMAVLDNAWICTNDSRVLARAARLRGKTLTFAPGSYIVRALFERRLIQPDDRLTVLGGTPDITAILVQRYGLTALRQHIPPMGFIHDAAAVAAAIAFVQANPARFVFIAMGAPQSDLLAARIKQAGGATGLGLNIGSSLGTLAGLNARTPDWMEKNGLVWLYRLIREPRRLARRYFGPALEGLVRGVAKG
jgi:exopolysaccharide biosynthesis WecB/TagA/CpsF family protein